MLYPILPFIIIIQFKFKSLQRRLQSQLALLSTHTEGAIPIFYSLLYTAKTAAIASYFPAIDDSYVFLEGEGKSYRSSNNIQQSNIPAIFGSLTLVCSLTLSSLNEFSHPAACDSI